MKSKVLKIAFCKVHTKANSGIIGLLERKRLMVRKKTISITKTDGGKEPTYIVCIWTRGRTGSSGLMQITSVHTTLKTLIGTKW